MKIKLIVPVIFLAITNINASSYFQSPTPGNPEKANTNQFQYNNTTLPDNQHLIQLVKEGIIPTFIEPTFQAIQTKLENTMSEAIKKLSNPDEQYIDELHNTLKTQLKIDAIEKKTLKAYMQSITKDSLKITIKHNTPQLLEGYMQSLKTSVSGQVLESGSQTSAVISQLMQFISKGIKIEKVIETIKSSQFKSGNIIQQSVAKILNSYLQKNSFEKELQNSIIAAIGQEINKNATELEFAALLGGPAEIIGDPQNGSSTNPPYQQSGLLGALAASLQSQLKGE